MNIPNSNPKISITPPKPIEVDDSTSKTIIIVLLVLIIVIFTSLGSFATDFINNLLYSTGWFIGKTSDVTFKVGAGSLMLANGAVHNGSNLMIKASGKDDLKDGAKNGVSKKTDEPAPDTATNPIQKPITSGKTNWCLVGEYQGRRGCIEIGENDKCMSGQIFPSQYTCLNPNFSQNVLPNMTTPMGVPPRMELNQLPLTSTFAEQQYVQSQISSPTPIYNQGTVVSNQQSVVDYSRQDARQAATTTGQDVRQDSRQDARQAAATTTTRQDVRQDARQGY